MRPAPPVEFERRDLAWAALTAAVGAALFATSLTGHPGLGDAPESVTGVKSLGVLHAPGYPSYVLAAHLFTLLVPFGSEAFKVNLFSLVCAALSLAGVQLLARRFGAPRWACVLGALALGATPVLWFYSGFAKHDTFSGLLFLLTLHLALAWRVQPTRGRLVALAAVIAVGLGSAWPLEVLVLPAVAFVLLAGRRDLHLRSVAVSAATGLAMLVAVYGFVMIRAAQNPPVNWDHATTLSRLVALIDRADFKHVVRVQVNIPQPVVPGGAVGDGASTPHAGAIAPASAAVLSRVSGAVEVFAREFGVLGLLLALLGLLASLVWRRGRASFPVLIAFVANLLGASIAVSFGAGSGSVDTDLALADAAFGCYFALGCWIAVGAAEVVEGVFRLSVSMRPRLIGRLLSPAAAVALAAAVLVPQVIDGWPVANRTHAPYADRYATAVLAPLPTRAAVFVSNYEPAQALIYRQVVEHQRPDVTVIAAGNMRYQWYHQELERQLGIRLPAPSLSLQSYARTVKAVAAVRPVYLDPEAALALAGLVGSRPVGLLAALAPGRGVQAVDPQRGAVDSPDQAEARVAAAVRRAGFPDRRWDVWPNELLEQAGYSAAAGAHRPSLL